jgi:hypothetical protein
LGQIISSAEFVQTFKSIIYRSEAADEHGFESSNLKFKIAFRITVGLGFELFQRTLYNNNRAAS